MSGFYHASLTFIGQFLDNMGMFLILDWGSFPSAYVYLHSPSYLYNKPTNKKTKKQKKPPISYCLRFREARKGEEVRILGDIRRSDACIRRGEHLGSLDPPPIVPDHGAFVHLDGGARRPEDPPECAVQILSVGARVHRRRFRLLDLGQQKDPLLPHKLVPGTRRLALARFLHGLPAFLVLSFRETIKPVSLFCCSSCSCRRRCKSARALDNISHKKKKPIFIYSY